MRTRLLIVVPLLMVFFPAGAQEPLKGKKLAIEFAKYGAGDSWIDVTETVRALQVKNRLIMESTSLLAEDPLPDTPKELHVQYRSGSAAHAVVIPENHVLTIDSDGTATVHGADYVPPELTDHSKTVRAVMALQPSLVPERMVFEIRQGPHDKTGKSVSTTRDTPRVYQIADQKQVRLLLMILRNIRMREDRPWYDGHGYYFGHIYTLTWIYPSEYARHGHVPLVKSFSLDLSTAVGNLYEYDALERALKNYPPGFTAQQHALLQ